MKKIISLIFVLCTLLCCSTSSVFAFNAENDSEIGLQYLYARSVSPTLSISSNKVATYSCTVTGDSSTTRIEINLYLQKLNNGTWVSIDNVSKDVNGSYAKASDTKSSLTSSCVYRTYADVYVYSGSAYEHIKKASSSVTRP